MSTKIYDAFIMVDDVSLFELKHRMQKLRDETHKIIQQEAHKLIASDCAELVDLCLNRLLFSYDQKYQEGSPKNTLN